MQYGRLPGGPAPYVDIKPPFEGNDKTIILIVRKKINFILFFPFLPVGHPKPYTMDFYIKEAILKSRNVPINQSNVTNATKANEPLLSQLKCHSDNSVLPYVKRLVR